MKRAMDERHGLLQNYSNNIVDTVTNDVSVFMSMAHGASHSSGKKVMRLESILNNIIEGNYGRIFC